ncbi:MAG: DHHW family protein, partial [Anaerovorax sp.]
MKNLDKLPYGLENLDQNTYIGPINEEIQAVNTKKGVPALAFDMKDLILDYYKTDHHWTTLGAYKAYEGMMKKLGVHYVSMEAGILGKEREGDKTLGQVDVPGFYGTYFNKTKAFQAVPDVLSYYDIPVKKVAIDGKKAEGLYDLKKLETRDKYGMFLGGNNGVTVIESENSVKKPGTSKTRVLLIKDSFGNCFAPYLTYSFDEVVVVDLRSMDRKMSQLMAQNKFDQVIIMYNFMNLAQDVNIAKISY